MEKIVVELDVKSKDGVKEVEKLNKTLTETNEKSKEAGASLDGISGGAIGKFKGLQSSVGGVVKSFKSLKFAILASGIGALLLAVVAVGKAFTSSEEGQDKFAKIMAVIGSVTGNLLDILSDLGEKIISVFENPKQSVIDFSNLIKNNILNRFNGILELIPALSKSIKQLFKGDFTGAAQTAGNAVAKVTLGTDNLTESIKKTAEELKKFSKEVADDAKKAGEIADQRAKADAIERDLIVERSKANRKRADLLDKSQNRTLFNEKQRIDFLRQASKVEDEITKKEIRAAEIRRFVAIEENKLSKSNKEALLAEEEAKAKVIDLETARLSKQKELTGQIAGLLEQEKAGVKAMSDERKRASDEAISLLAKEQEERIKKANEEAKTESDRLNSIAAIQDEFTKRREDDLAVTNIQKLDLEKERKILALEQLGADEQQKADILKFYAEKIAEENIAIQKKAGEEQVANDKAVAEAKASIAASQLNIASQGFVLLGQLAGKNKALQAVALIGDSAVGIAKMVAANNLANIGALATPQAIATSGAAAIPVIAFNNISTGLGIASTIAATAKGLGALGGGGSAPSRSSAGGIGSAPSVASIPPAFNVVGQSDTNQLASAIGGQSQKPSRAYVVSSDVTTSQEMDRNIIKGASL